MGVELHREAWPTIYLKVKELEVFHFEDGK